LVLKAPHGDSVVHRRDAVREARIMDAANRAGAPVPRIVGVDADGRAIGRTCFVMEHVAGRSPADTALAGYHDDAWLQGLGADEQRKLWLSFYDALGGLHTIDSTSTPEASLGAAGQRSVIGYWREALLAAVEEPAVPRQLALLDWLSDNLPADADERPALCMGDARFVNCIIDDGKVQALIDFEVAYAGNPAADVGYSVFVDAQQRQNAENPLPGIGTADEAWARWEAATGRTVADRAYWTAFGAMVLGITATRAMVQWGLAGPDLEATNPLVAAWEDLVERATV
jgi:aminoglycoside phosphotransferase (APT) family kinase protein